MVPYTGRRGCNQYIHGKPIRYGFKLWVGMTRQGYIYWFEPYLGTSVVLEYADALRSKWRDRKFNLSFDNFFLPSLY